MKIALLISTFNRPDALELCLKSIINQVLLPDEIIIADDGSTYLTKNVIEAYKDKINSRVVHVWHEDNGFQLAKIRNKAIAQIEADYIIQIDGDLVLHPYFIKDHRDFAKPNTFVRASRVYLDKELTERKLSYKEFRINCFERGVSNVYSALRMPMLRSFFENSYKIKGYQKWEIHGCNMAFWREDALKVNGYNEDFVGWGPEDKEFVARLLNLGLQKRFLKFGAIVFHLWHHINEKDNLNNNELIFEETKKFRKTFCVNGINKYLSFA